MKKSEVAEILEKSKPTYTLSAMDKVTKKRHPVGAGWIGENGMIAITINRFVVLSGQDDTMILKLFPKKVWTSRPDVEGSDDQ